MRHAELTSRFAPRGEMSVSKWKAFATGSPLRALAQDALLSSAASVFARCLGFGKEIVVAAYYGLSGAFDVYLLALTLIGLPASILVNAVHTALVSALAARGHSFLDSGRVFITTTLIASGCLAVLLPLWLLFVISQFPLFASGFSTEKQYALQSALYWLTPWYFLNVINVLGYGVLQANRRYLANGLIPLVTPIATVLLLVAIGVSHDWRPLAAALVTGTTLESGLLFLMLYRDGKLAALRLSSSPAVRAVLRGTLALVPGTIMVAIAPVVEQAIAASLGEGTNAALSYGNKLPAALISVSATAIGVTTLPYFASQIAKRQFHYSLHSLDMLGRWILIGALFLVIPLIAFSPEIVAILYKRGAFDETAVARVSPIQLVYFAQIPFAIVAMPALKALSALGRNSLVSLYTAVTLILQTTLAYALGLRLGAPGIAWAAVTGSAALAIVAFLSARQTLVRMLS